jgi:diguanylate cyclase (GGDEF)-like protein/PAS domain S-box-containing protein
VALPDERVGSEQVMARAAGSPAALYRRLETMFVLFNLAIAAALGADALLRGRALGADIVLGFILVIAGARWYREYQGQRFSSAWDLFDGTLIVALCIATLPLDALLLVYSRVVIRTLDVGASSKLRTVVIFTGAFLAGVGLSALVAPGHPVIELLFLAISFPMSAVVMGTIGTNLRNSESLAARVTDAEMTARLGSIVEHARDLILVFEAGDRVSYASPSVLRATGREDAPQQLADLVHPEDVIAAGNALARARAAGVGAERFQFRLPSGDGGWRHVEALASAGSPGLRSDAVVMTARDMTDWHATQESLLRSEENFRLLFAYNPQPMWVYDRETLAFLEVNRAATEHYGFSRDEFLSMTIADIRPAEDASRARKKMPSARPEGEAARDWRHQLKDGRLIYVDVTSHRLDFGGRPASLVLAQDITERRELDQRLRHQAFHDPLTGLANRALFRDRVEHALKRDRRRAVSSAVVFIDLDNFKTINDSVGHNAGDAVLVEFSRRLSAAVRPGDTAARLGGDEFGILVEALPNESNALRMVQRVTDALNNPIDVEGDTWFVSGSVGIAFTGTGGDDVDSLLRSADVAMYDAKRRGRGQVAVFEPAMHQAVLDRMALENDLRQAIENNELVLHYQPQLDLARNEIVGVEALVRWEHPRRGLVSPGEFIPLAEEAGMVDALDDWVLRQAATQSRLWTEAGIRPITVGVNVSGKEFADPHMAARIASTVADAGVSPRRIELEVTESSAFEIANARSTLAQLRGLGFRVAIDDFGVGFSMLSRLQDLAVDRLKIDRSFIEKITFGEDEAPIVSGIVAMAHSLRLKVVAEGVETSEQLTFLRRVGCDQGQGFRLGRPMRPQDIEPLLLQRATTKEHG